MHALAYGPLVLYCHVTRGPFDPGAGKPLFFFTLPRRLYSQCSLRRPPCKRRLTYPLDPEAAIALPNWVTKLGVEEF